MIVRYAIKRKASTKAIVKIERIEHEQIFGSENLDINHFMEISSLRKYNSNVAIMPKLRSGCCSKSSPLPKIHDQRLILKKERFRPIRPKQLVSTIVRHKSGLSPVMNITALPSNHLLVSHPASIRETFQCTTNVSNKINNCIELNSSNNINNSDNSNVIGSNINIINNDTINDSNNSNTLNILLETEESNIDKIVKTDNSNTIANNNCNCNNNSNSSNNSSNSSNNSSNNYNNCDKNLHTANTISKSHKNSIKLFFESMTQTVLNLPNEVQADIKMQICRLV